MRIILPGFKLYGGNESNVILITSLDYYDNGSPDAAKVELGRNLFVDKVLSGSLNTSNRRLVDTAGLVTSQKKAVNPNRINRFGMTGVSGFA